MKRQKIGRKLRATPKDAAKEWAKIGHTVNSETFFPSIYESSGSPFVYCDCPGFNDTRTDVDRLNTTIATQLLINFAEQIKGVIIIVDAGSLSKSADRGASMRQLSTTLSKLLKADINPNSILFIFNDRDLEPGSDINLDEVLSDIHYDIKDIEENEKSKLQKIAKQIEAGRAGDKEYVKVWQSLLMLSRISSNKHNTCVVNLFDNFESKKQIEALVRKVQPTSKDSFSFSTYNNTRVKFNIQLTEIVKNLSNNMMYFIHSTKNLIDNNETIESCEERIKCFKKQIALLDPDKEMQDENKIPLLQQQLRGFNQRIDRLKEKRESSKKQITDLTIEKADLDTNEEIIYWQHNVHTFTQEYLEEFSKGPGFTWFYSTTFTERIKYNGIPFIKAEKSYSRFYIESTAMGQYEIKKECKGEGIYDAYFIFNPNMIQRLYTKDREKGLIVPKNLEAAEARDLVKVSIYVKKANIPHNKARIAQIDKEIAQEQRSLEKYNKEVEEIKRANENAESLLKFYKEKVTTQRKQIKDRKQQLEEEVARIQREKADVEADDKKHQEIQGNSGQYLYEKERLLANVNTIISYGILTEANLIEEYKRYYNHYKGLQDQGTDYLFTLTEKDSPEFLQCPLRTDIFVDPVITACGHTFSQYNLLQWLDVSKTCPTCRKSVSDNEIKSNISIRQAVEQFEKEKRKSIVY